ncbi:MAG: hypothetical protein K0S04_918 [Herbinix sp.]|jgi:hypothetical protein|nr:hypothetical protein [Herbinix sp.]
MNNRRPILYILAGIYLLYIDYSLIKNWASLENKVLFVIFMVVFGAIGGGLVIYSAWKLLKDRYQSNNPYMPQNDDNIADESKDEEASNQDHLK